MKKTLLLLYGILCYTVFIGAVLYAIGFTGNVMVGNTLDAPPRLPLLSAILIDASLALFLYVQYGLMSKPGFKRWLTRFVPHELERCSLVILSSFTLLLAMWQWQPLGGVVWSLDNSIAEMLLTILYLAGWGTVFVSTFLLNHFELFGLRQAWLLYQGRQYAPLVFRLPGFYRLARHPLYLGFFIVVWATPQMTISHLLLALFTSVYIILSFQSGKVGMTAQLVKRIRVYRRLFPMLLPLLIRRMSRYFNRML